MIPRKLAIALSIAVLALFAACGGEEQVLSPTATPESETKFVPNLEPQTQSLMLRLASPDVNLVTDSDLVAVTGVASPDATVSVNGHLAFLDAQGRFSITIDQPQNENPAAIEVVATSITGEHASQVRPVIFSDTSGVFGSVTEVTQSGITIQTGSGPVTLAVDASTNVRMHGWDSPSPSNIVPGTPVAVLTDGLRAVSVLAVPGRPVLTRHFTGLDSAGSDSARNLTLRDDSGRQVTAIAPNGLDMAPIGEMVTAVLEQDLSTGSLTVTALDRAISGAERLEEALALEQDTGASEPSANTSALRWRLVEHGVRNISMLANGNSEALAKANDFYAGLFSRHHLGAPSADVTGLVSSIDTDDGQITVQPHSGPAVMVRLSDTTEVALFGERIRSGQLDLASRVTIRYALAGGDASRVTVLAGNTLPNDASIQLAITAGRGEVLGTLTEVGPDSATVTILDPATGEEISLQAAGAVVLWDGVAVDLESFSEGAGVFVRFDPGSHRLLELESTAPLGSDELVSGVVHSFIPKMADGNLTIRTQDGRLQSFTHHAGTVIRREGLHVSINDVQVGDLVRPNTRVRPPDTLGGQASEIVVLSLKAPEPGLVTGFIRGVSAGPEGEVVVTLTDIWLELFSLRIGPNTTVTQQGHNLAIPDLTVGQEITQGFYDPVSLVAAQIDLAPDMVSVRASLGR